MIGGSSSFDIVPAQYGKPNAVRRYLAENGMNEQEIRYCGDDYEEGGNDYDVYAGGIPYVKGNHYDRLGEVVREQGLLEEDGKGRAEPKEKNADPALKGEDPIL